jgi:hypothetical protein
MQDLVAQLPGDLNIYKQENGSLPSDVKIEPGFTCIWQDRYFIHTRATLPLKDIHDGIGFGLWVEISKEDFDRYLGANENDEDYLKFKTEGTLANEWPGFEDILGIPVVVRAIRADQKVYITEVKIDRPRDPLFEVSLLAQKDDVKIKEQIKNLIEAYMLQ